MNDLNAAATLPTWDLSDLYPSPDGPEVKADMARAEQLAKAFTAHAGTLAGLSGAALAALVGRNRAAVLSAVADGCTTTELAGRVGISLAAASQHASVLRDAGLITSCRQGGAVLHALTPLGADLLQAG